VSYSGQTFADSNPVKRWLQRRRLESAISVAGGARPPRAICDFGAGNGELCKRLAARHPGARIVCYEPAGALLAEARENLRALGGRIEYRGERDRLGDGEFDVVYCLEVFEHLPAQERAAALATLARILAAGGLAVIGVPVETGLPALYKGLFRMTRRFGAFDATPSHVLRAFLGRPPERPVAEIAPGLRFHFDHLGFDHRRFARELRERFVVAGHSTSPFELPGAWIMPEVNFVVSARAAP
jgi:SAM-dependent methyltransferase